MTNKKYILGIDVGTTGTKALLFTSDGMAVAHAYRSYKLSSPKIGYSEQNALDWWEAIIDTVREIGGQYDIKESVSAISLSTQGGTLVPVDSLGNPLRPAIVWNDARCEKERERYLSEVGESFTMYEKTGWNLGHCLHALEVRWLRDNEPEVFKKTDKFLSVPDFISMKMTGIAAVDFSNAGINQTVNVREMKYDTELLRFMGVGEERLPKLVNSGETIGNLTKSAAEALGLSEKTVFVAGAHDQYAVSLGAGAISDGDILIGSGTCWVITAIAKEPDFASGLAQSRSAVPGLWGSIRSLATGGVCLEWLRRNIAKSEDDGEIDYDTINREVEKLSAAEDGLFFFPFSGRTKKTPFKKATFTGLDISHNRFHLARAVMEGVAFQIMWMMESFRTKPREDGILLSGGASKSSVWTQILADIANLPIKVSEIADLACVGAAILAGVGAGVYTSFLEAYSSFSVNSYTVRPNPEKAAVYAKLFERYKKQADVLAEMYNVN